MGSDLFQNERKRSIMECKKNQTIYLQIADFICENILTQAWPIEEKVASVRELAAMIEVNPNTVMRTYSHLQEKGIIFNKRGIGFFVSPDAPQKIQNMEKANFVKNDLPLIFKKMELLKIDFSELEKLYKQSKNGKH